MVKHDWSKLKTEYLTGDFVSLASFFRSKGISDDTNATKLKTKGWREERKSFWEAIGRKKLKEVERKENAKKNDKTYYTCTKKAHSRRIH